MKILIAPDKFKGSLSALEVAKALERGLAKSNKALELIIHPMADGGDGSLEVISNHWSLAKHETATVDPLGRSIIATYFTAKGAAFIELASASGLVLLTKKERNPLLTSTIGSGKMIVDAIKKGFEEIYLFLGGSATNDGGMGIATELGFQFLNSDKKVLFPSGENLSKVTEVNNSAIFDFDKIKITLLCDVNNPLFGRKGAAPVYAAQKGANRQQIDDLDSGLRHYSQVIEKYVGFRIDQLPGMGAAGGIGASLVALCQAQIVPGFARIAQMTSLELQIQAADWVISGEGQLDEQSLQGKVIGGIAALCKKYGKPLVLFVGENSLNQEVKQSLATKTVFSIMEIAKDLDDAMTNGAGYLEELAGTFYHQYLEEKNF